MDEYIKIFETEIIEEIFIQAQNDSEIVKSNLTNYYGNNIIERIVKLYNNNYSKEEDLIKRRRKVKQLLTIASSEYGPDFLTHLAKYRAYTDFELLKLYGISKQTAAYIRKKLVSLNFHHLEQVTEIKNPVPTKSGPKPGIWISIYANEEDTRNAQKRYYDLYPKKSLNHKNYSRIVDLIIKYMDSIGVKKIGISELIKKFPNTPFCDLQEACNELNRQQRDYIIFVQGRK
jgi:hypothetical protein